MDDFHIFSFTFLEIVIDGVFSLDALADSTKDLYNELSSVISGLGEVSFYWLDAWEADQRLVDFKGCVFMFGKLRVPHNGIEGNIHIQEHSCCCIIDEIPRVLYLIPKYNIIDPHVDFASCYNEFNQIASTYRILEFSSRKVEKNICFGSNCIYSSHQILEIRYSRIYPIIPKCIKCNSFNLISRSFANALEYLLIDSRIKGPCWLSLSDFNVFPFQYPTLCKVNLSIHGPHSLRVQPLQPPPPTFTVLSLCVRYIYPVDNKQNKEIVILAYCVEKKYKLDETISFENYLCKVVNVKSCQLENHVILNAKEHGYSIISYNNERSMLLHFFNQFNLIDPDFILGHDTNFWLNLILHRAVVLQIEDISIIGRLKCNISSTYKNSYQATMTPGRVICDLCYSVKELLKLDCYDVSSISSSILHIEHDNLNHNQVKEMLVDTIDQAIKCIEHSFREATLFFQISNELNVLQLAFQLTTLAGNLISRTLLGGRAERNDYLLLHAFHSNNYILPEKRDQFHTEVPLNNGNMFDSLPKKKSSYSGGLVFEPKKGLYHNYILVLDFNSLYPSIIQEYNICFSTVEMISKSEFSEQISTNKKPLGVIPKELELLVQKRRQIKMLLRETSKSSVLYLKYDIRQKALKLTANSIYGCLGYSNSRFFAIYLASMVTSLGREILSSTKYFVESHLALEVIYGDTDSIMINTNASNFEQVSKLGNYIKSQINEKHKLLEIDIDSVYKRLLLLKKKKYAALAVTLSNDGNYSESFEIKGLDVIRRDWCHLSKRAGKFIIEIILKNDYDSLIQKLNLFLSKFAYNLRNSHIPIHEFVIYKTLTKMPQDYSESCSYPHVAVARWINRSGSRIAIGHSIPYVICLDGSNNNALKRAYHPDQLQKSLGVYNAELSIDNEYYLSNQVYPVVSRICSTIIDPKLIAEFLGIDSTSMKHEQMIEKDFDTTTQPDFKICCPQCNCNSSFTYRGNLKSNVTCINCSFIFTNQELYFASNIQFRNILSLLYHRRQVCADSSCKFQTKQINLVKHFGLQRVFCFRCHQGILGTKFKPYSISRQLNDLNLFLSGLEDSQFNPSLNFVLAFSRFKTVSLQRLFQANSH